MNEIEDIRIGYSWTISSESVQIVEFTPTWYIKEWNLEDACELKAEKHRTRTSERTQKQREVTQMDYREYSRPHRLLSLSPVILIPGLVYT